MKRIETPTVFDPINQSGASINAKMFPDNGGKHILASKGVGHAYVRCSPQNSGKIKNPLIFVDGIDFNKTMKCNPLGGNKTIRYGDFGWDVFYMEHKADISWDFV